MIEINKEKAKLIKKSLLLIEEFSHIDIDDFDDKDYDFEKIKILIKKTKIITGNIHWKLK